MRAPTCLLCEGEHWRTQPCPTVTGAGAGEAIARKAVAPVTGRADGAPAKAEGLPAGSDPVEMPDTLLVEPGLWAALKDAAAEIKRGKGRPAKADKLTAADRARAYRARKKGGPA